MRHGTRSMYVRERCRCAACVQVNRDYQRDYLRRRRVLGLVDGHGKRLRFSS